VAQEINLGRVVGYDGKKGASPKHEWSGTNLRFKNPDDTWGEFVNLKGATGANGSGGSNTIRRIWYGHSLQNLSIHTGYFVTHNSNVLRVCATGEAGDVVAHFNIAPFAPYFGYMEYRGRGPLPLPQLFNNPNNSHWVDMGITCVILNNTVHISVFNNGNSLTTPQITEVSAL